MEKAITWALAIALAAIVVVPISLYYAWTATVLWGWFVVPIFNVPQLTIWQAWGLSLTMGVFRPKTAKSETNWQAVLILPPMALAVGYIIR